MYLLLVSSSQLRGHRATIFEINSADALFIFQKKVFAFTYRKKRADRSTFVLAINQRPFGARSCP